MIDCICIDYIGEIAAAVATILLLCGLAAFVVCAALFDRGYHGLPHIGPVDRHKDD